MQKKAVSIEAAFFIYMIDGFEHKDKQLLKHAPFIVQSPGRLTWVLFRNLHSSLSLF
ncbi:MAG: hypothetical protein Q7T76_21900 [Ferruginibacter sp.]|nr:hypothetical protein [Ferruginibacter sp.]